MTGSSWAAANAEVLAGRCDSLRTIAVSSAMGIVAELACLMPQGDFACELKPQTLKIQKPPMGQPLSEGTEEAARGTGCSL